MEKNITPIEKIWDEVFGSVGSKERIDADEEAKRFCQSERQKEITTM